MLSHTNCPEMGWCVCRERAADARDRGVLLADFLFHLSWHRKVTRSIGMWTPPLSDWDLLVRWAWEKWASNNRVPFLFRNPVLSIMCIWRSSVFWTTQAFNPGSGFFRFCLFSFFFLFFFFFGCGMQKLDVGSQFPGIEPRLQQWKCWVLTTRPPGNSLSNPGPGIASSQGHAKGGGREGSDSSCVISPIEPPLGRN